MMKSIVLQHKYAEIRNDKNAAGIWNIVVQTLISMTAPTAQKYPSSANSYMIIE